VRPRRVWLRVVLLYALVSATAVGVLAWYAVDSGSRRLEAQAVADLRSQIDQVLGAYNADKPPTDQYDTWIWDIGAQKASALGQTDVEPPFRTIVQEAVDGGGSATDTFSLSGSRYLISAQRILGTPQVLVAAADRGGTESRIGQLRWRIGLAAGAVVVFTSVMAALLSGWSLRPVRRAAEQQREFLADAAHELRTPLAVIRAAASQALQRERAPEEYVRALAEIRVAAERAGVAVSDMLDLARLEAGQAGLRRGPLRLDLLVEEVVSSIGPTDGVQVDMAASQAIVVDADYSLLRQAIDNVVRNAVGRSTAVRAEVKTVGRVAVIEVGDDGPGFAPDLLPQVFERFHGDRGDGSAGAGLGLAIVRHVVEAHGGSAQAANRPEGGAVVRLRLPLPGERSATRQNAGSR
jgi:two-component system OmpR family sensor kinase